MSPGPAGAVAAGGASPPVVARPAEAAPAYMRATGVTKRFARFAAVDDVSIAVGEGDTLALLGPSGCGKTTFLRCIAGLETPEAGHIEIGGNCVYDAGGKIELMPERRELGMVFQSYAVWPHMSVAENVGFPLKVRGLGRREAGAQIDEILALVGLTAWRDRSAMALSGGQQQRVALARALVHKPRLVLFDEPMSNLDAQLRDQMRVELKLLQQRLGFTSVYVTHDQAEAFALARRIVVMNRGRVEAAGAPQEVFRRPATPFVARFFGYNLLPGRAVALSAEDRGGLASRRVEVALGEDLRLWGVSHGAAPVSPGDPVMLCVRKEHVTLEAKGRDRFPGGPDRAQAFPAQLRAASFQGLYDEYVIGRGSLELRATQPACGIEAGTVTVSLDPENCLVLPAGEATQSDPAYPEGLTP